MNIYGVHTRTVPNNHILTWISPYQICPPPPPPPNMKHIDSFGIPTPFTYHPIWQRCDLGVLQDLLWSILYIKCSNPYYSIEYAHCFVMWLRCDIFRHILRVRGSFTRTGVKPRCLYTQSHTHTYINIHIYIWLNKYLLFPWYCKIFPAGITILPERACECG